MRGRRTRRTRMGERRRANPWRTMRFSVLGNREPAACSFLQHSEIACRLPRHTFSVLREIGPNV